MSNFNLNEIKSEIKVQLNEHVNKLKSIKEMKQSVETEINDMVLQVTRRLIRQKIEILKKVNKNEKLLESNLNNLISKEHDLLNKFDNINNYDEIISGYNQLNASDLNVNFDYVFKKNEKIEENFLSIGDLLLLVIFFYNLLFFILIN